MLRASVISPFYEEAQGQPWVTWTRQEPVLGLAEPSADGCGPYMEEPAEPADGPMPVQAAAYVPQHHRYNAVIAKMKQASQKSGTFAQWHT